MATVVDPPGDNNSPYEVLLATHEGKTTPYVFELNGTGTSMPPVASNDLPATPAGGSGSGGGTGSTSGGTDVSTGGAGNNNNIILIGGQRYQVVPVDGGGTGTGSGSGTGTGSGTTTATLPELKDQLLKDQKQLAKTTDQILTEINNQLNTPTPVPASNSGSTTTSSSSGTQTASR